MSLFLYFWFYRMRLSSSALCYYCQYLPHPATLYLTVEQVMSEFDISRATVFREYAKIKVVTGAFYDKADGIWKLK